MGAAVIKHEEMLVSNTGVASTIDPEPPAAVDTLVQFCGVQKTYDG